MDSDCLGELVCLYSYELPSRLHYISPNSPDAYRCGKCVIPEHTDFNLNLYNHE